MAYKDNEEQKASWRRYYQRNKKKIIAWHKRDRAKIVAMVTKLKDVPCADCNNKFPGVCMDFAHKNMDEKIDGIARMAQNGTMKKLLNELKKCDIICSNCHRIRTAKELGWLKN